MLVKEIKSKNPATKHLCIGDTLVALNDIIVLGQPLCSVLEKLKVLSKPVIFYFSNI